MKSDFAIFIRSNRKFFAVAMLFFLAMKGFGFLGMASAIGKHPDTAPRSFAITVLGAHCDRHHDNGAPQDTHAHHSECCIICSNTAKLTPLDDTALLGAVAALLTPRVEAPPARISFSFHDQLLAYSSGLFSDWSPTAPPVA